MRVSGITLLVVPDANEVAGRMEGRPRDVEPAGAGQELVGQGVGFQERDQALELGGVLGADVGSLALEVLGISDATHLAVHGLAAEAGVDDDGAADGLAGGLQQLATTVGHVGYLLDGGDVLRVLFTVAVLGQLKMFREFDVFHSNC